MWTIARIGDPSRQSRGRTPALAHTVAYSLVLMLVLAAAHDLRAQSPAPQPVTIALAPIVFVEAGTTTPLPIRVRPVEGIEKGSFVRIRGMPTTASLSEGYVIASGVWAVPLFALQRLSLVAPADLRGRADILISLVNIDGATIAEARTVLVAVAAGASPQQQQEQEQPRITAPAPVPAAPPANAPAAAPARAVPQPPTLPPQERERALGLHASGEEHLKAGNIVAARRFLERAAEIGLGASALLLGDTYEPGELARLRVIGLRPDIDAARTWYERALQLGVADAVERLRRLPAKP